MYMYMYVAIFQLIWNLGTCEASLSLSPPPLYPAMVVCAYTRIDSGSLRTSQISHML